MELKIKKQDKKTLQKPTFRPYEEENQLRPLKLFIITAPYGQGNAIRKILDEYETSLVLTMNGEGVSFRSKFEMYNSSKKNIIFAIVRDDKADAVKRRLDERFNVSRASSGVAFVISLSSIVGVTIYKFLSNTRKVKKEPKYYAKRSIKN